MRESDIPPGFAPLPRSSPLLELIGPVYGCGSGSELRVGLRADARHANGRGRVHGGIIATLADIGMGYAWRFPAIRPCR